MVTFKDIQRYFIRSEGNTALADEWHGTDGPLGVSNIADPQPLTRAFVMSCQQQGIPLNPDFNGAEQAGTGYYQLNVVGSRRVSAARGYLDPARGRKNLTILTGARAHRLTFDGYRATGVVYECRGKIETATAEAEVIVTAGAIGSPKLLMLSGIGPAEHLREMGIEVRADVAGVGANLSDHVNIDLVAELKNHLSLDKYKKPHWAAWAGLQYALFRSGPVASNVVEGGLFWYSGQDHSTPVRRQPFCPVATTKLAGSSRCL